MKNKYYFLIKDSKKGFKVHQVAPNGEMINTNAQPLDSVDNVYKNILASMRVSNGVVPNASELRSEKARKQCLEYWVSGLERIYIKYEGKKSQVLKELFS